MVTQLESALRRNLGLASFDNAVEKLFDPTALIAHDVIVMTFTHQLKDGLVTLEMQPRNEARRLELRQDSIHRRQTDLLATVQQFTIDGFSGQMTGI